MRDEHDVQIKGGLVYIGQGGPLNRESLVTRIENIRNRRNEYATENAWRLMLGQSIYALALLDATTKKESA